MCSPRNIANAEFPTRLKLATACLTGEGLIQDAFYAGRDDAKVASRRLHDKLGCRLGIARGRDEQRAKIGAAESRAVDLFGGHFNRNRPGAAALLGG
jgi:hypothetical protein